MIHRPALSADPEDNRRTLQEILDGAAEGGELVVPAGTHRVADGLRVPAGWTVSGRSAAGDGTVPQTWIESTGTAGHPILHVTGSDVAIRDLGLRPPAADPGEHGGDRGTAITIGDYLYEAAPAWIERVDVRRVHVERPDERHANCVAVMGAVRDIVLHDITIRGGYTGVAVHWGAVGGDVSTIVGPTFHPHGLTITDLRVRDAIEGFYLSSVHDATVRGGCMRNVDFGFRLLPGDNTDRWAPSSYDGTAPRIGSNIEIADQCVSWNGPRYGVRVAGWGRSEVDGLVSELAYENAVIRDCRLFGAGSGEQWAPVMVERAAGVELTGILSSTIGECSCTLSERN
ncbi:hypothetical protein [Mangrovihabitans endophyticus]|uniref:Uncharacterized protein n=1 Tax=Mangrovihabitans endophyticus TaxID=1751298 RepID=A0A8J3C2I5_9ACTN|nr:hypothetical protein [Mangrovihabitans endophyticus]GGK97996.1 hypothetical protein GCM10012284_35310 [Mangrovihabitans endophyticus]